MKHFTFVSETVSAPYGAQKWTAVLFGKLHTVYRSGNPQTVPAKITISDDSSYGVQGYAKLEVFYTESGWSEVAFILGSELREKLPNHHLRDWHPDGAPGEVFDDIAQRLVNEAHKLLT